MQKPPSLPPGVPLYTHATQQEPEIAALIEAFKRERVASFLEVGSRYGGTLWRVARQVLPAGSRVISVDSGVGMGGRKPGAPEALEAGVQKLCELGYDARLFVGQSRDKALIGLVREHAPFDAVFLDADHTYAGVKSDWLNYGPMARLVAFHDIAWVRPQGHDPANGLVDVGRLWKELKKDYRHQEFIHPGGNMGIGLLWRF